MKRLLLISALACAAGVCEAAEFGAQVLSSECELVAKSGSTTGALVGSGTGAVVGSLFGRALFGRTGGTIGAMVGSVGGGVAGENIAANRTYSCLLTIRDPKGQTIYVETVGRLRNAGEAVRVFTNPDGTYLVR